LFEMEVPEIYDGTVVIKSAVREPGERAKIAVMSNERDVDPVGACVGMKGSRVQAVVNELSGERIDIVPWSDDVSTFISRALSPAKISQVRSDIEMHSVLVVVDEDQLSLAIGKEGQNVRLASRLAGWQIELVSNRELEQRQRLQEHLLMPIEEMVGVSDKMAEKLREAGINTVQKLMRTPVEKLAEIPGFGERTVEKLMETAQGTVKELESALEELIKKENEEREQAKKSAKPLFDESMLEAENEDPKKEEKVKITEAMLFRDPAEVEAEAEAEDTAATAVETEAAAAETPATEPVAAEADENAADEEKKDANE